MRMGSGLVLVKALRQVWKILSPKQKTEAVLLFLMMLVGMVLEIIGVGSIFPVMAMFGESDRISDFISTAPPSIGRFFLGMTSEKLFVLLLFCLVVVFLFKNLFLAILAWRQAKFAFGLQSELSQRIFELYLQRPYIYHIERNSAQLIRNTTVEVNAATFNVVLPSIYIMSEALVILGLSILLLSIEPLGAIISLTVLVLAALVFQKLTSKKIQRDGRSRQYHEGKRIQHLQQALNGIKEVKLIGCEQELLSRFQHHATQYSYVGRNHVTFQQLPRLWTEILAILGLALLVGTMVFLGQPLTVVLPTLALFAAASFRLMPSISRIITYLQSINFSTAVIELLHEELNSETQIVPPNYKDKILKEFSDKLEFREISYNFSSRDQPAVSKVDFSIPYGKTVGIIGSSGAGKSTLVEIALGLLEPDGGSVLVDGIDIRSNVKFWQKQIGYVPQSIFLVDDTIKRNVAFGLPDNQISEQKLSRALINAQLDQMVKDLPDGVETNVGEHGVRLSGGQRQRIGLARALYQNPSVLILDEATSSLDEETEIDVMKAINDLHGKKTIIIIAHRHVTLKNCDLIYSLKSGKINWSGSYESLLKLNKVISC